jgi:hypothetical protein
MAQTLPISTDIVVRAADGEVVALVEVKNQENLTPEIAAAIRRNLIVHGFANSYSRFFLIVSQDIGYLWDQVALSTQDAPLPTVEFVMAPVIEFYLPSLVGGRRLEGSSVELAVSQWLWELARGIGNLPKEPDLALAKTHFLRLIQGGQVEMVSHD